jgi:glycosidase
VLESSLADVRTDLTEVSAAVPAWAAGVVWYQVFPERFDNGDRENDPAGPGVFTVEWNQAWQAVTPGELEHAWESAAGMGQWRPLVDARRPVVDQVLTFRRYGGDLQGVVRRLDFLRDLGVTGLYMTPVFASDSMHKYDARDYRHVDPAFGPLGAGSSGETSEPATWAWSAADRYLLDVLLPSAHAHGMRLMLDGVWNHTGTSFWAFRDVMARGDASEFASWFDVRFGDADPRSPTAGRPVVGWAGFGGRNTGLPRFARLPGGELPEPVVQHLFDVTSRWMDPNGDGDPSDGIDAWRLDVAPELPRGFLKRWREHVRRINREALIVGEIWFDAKDYFDGTAFDAQMNYPWAMAVTRWIGKNPERGDLAAELTEVYSHAWENELAQMNLLSSHDVERVSSMMQNSTRARGYDQGAAPSRRGAGRAAGGRGRQGQNAAMYDDSRPDAESYRRALLGVALQVTLPGSPMLYAGDEWGMFGADDPDDRMPLPWPDLGQRDEGAENADVAHRDATRAWLRLRADPELAEVLRRGDLKFLKTPSSDVVVFTRRVAGVTVLVAANAGASAALLGGEGAVVLGAGGVEMPAVSCRLWVGGAAGWGERTPGR